MQVMMYHEAAATALFAIPFGRDMFALKVEMQSTEYV
jgi:hypothetical protein